MTLFSEYPELLGEKIILKKMSLEDVDDLERLTQSERVYKYLPTFLYEQRYEDKSEVITKMDAECFDTHKCILLGIYPVEEPGKLVGIGEIYNYEPLLSKASIGGRLHEDYWNKGYATEIGMLLTNYLFEVAGIKIITAHIMVQNGASERIIEKNEFKKILSGVNENWGEGKEKVRVDVYMRHHLSSRG